VPRFPIFADNQVRQQLVDGLLLRGWGVQRAIDVFPEKTLDTVLFHYAAEQGRDRAISTVNDRVSLKERSWRRRVPDEVVGGRS